MRYKTWWIQLFLVLATGLLTCCARHPQGELPSSVEAAAELEFERVRSSPVELRMFLQQFPKGGDLHSHLSGATYAEDFLEWAIADGLCIRIATLSAVRPPCDAAAGNPPLAVALKDGTVERDALIDRWSMRNYLPGYSAASGHEQFFRSFSLFSSATDDRDGDMVIEQVDQAVAQRIGYLELMLSLQRGRAVELGRRVVSPGGWNEFVDALLAAGIADLVPQAVRQVDDLEETIRQRYGCPDSGEPACQVEVRFLAQVVRTLPPEQVFAQSLLAFLLVRADPRVVGLNLVGPEDHPLVLAGYEAHMRQLGYLAGRFGSVPIALHAGELSLGLVHPRHLRTHIRQAVEIAGARRIGHGVSIAYEDGAAEVLQLMAESRIAVEINLTSNAQILGVSGDAHPFSTYLAHGVPLTVSTDDQGVSRGDLTHEYQRAVETYDLDYQDIVALSRNGLTYAFVEGASLWTDPDSFRPVDVCAGQRPGYRAPQDACAAFLAESHKARLQWRLEEQFAAFADRLSQLRRQSGR
jgi:adenosine deaminase